MFLFTGIPNATFSSTPTKYSGFESPGRNDAQSPMALKHTQQQLLQENEQFALAWLRATFELTPNLSFKIEEQEMYRMYISASSKVGRKGVLSPLHFPRCLRTVFGGTVGPNPSKDEDKTKPLEKILYFYCGIKIRTSSSQEKIVRY